MRRRAVLTGGLLGGIATTAGLGTRRAAADGHAGKTAFVLVHGSWHGGWCWGRVTPHLAAAGHLSLPIDLPGHGLNARLPASFLARPLDAAAFATEPSFIASIPTEAYADAVLDAAAAARAAGATRVIMVGHSMGGVPISFAAAKDPQAVDGLVYLTAVVATPGKPGGHYISLPEQTAQSMLGPLVMADPATIGAIRIDPRSTDPAYLAAAKEALAADVEEGLLASVMHLLTPDAPAAMYGELPEFSEAYAAIPRAFLRCEADRTLIPATQDVQIADMDAAFGTATQVYTLASSHEAMFAAPQALAEALVDFAA
ncbi:MAG: alpha/beta fold hydrolase [Pseudomonadota bacterium]